MNFSDLTNAQKKELIALYPQWMAENYPSIISDSKVYAPCEPIVHIKEGK
jgi:hypothetical protein